MKKRVTAAKQAANDKPGPVEQFQPGSTGPVRTGFLPVFVRPCKAAGTPSSTRKISNGICLRLAFPMFSLAKNLARVAKTLLAMKPEKFNTTDLRKRKSFGRGLIESRKE